MKTSITGRAWRDAAYDEGFALALQRQLGLPRLAAVALSQRVGPAEAADFLRPSLDHLHSPHAMRGMEVAVDRLQRAVVDRESMRIVTDYDVDGTTSSLILQGVLRLLGAKDRLSYHIPDRFVEGYGFSVRAAEQAAADGVKLIVYQHVLPAGFVFQLFHFGNHFVIGVQEGQIGFPLPLNQSFANENFAGRLRINFAKWHTPAAVNHQAIQCGALKRNHFTRLLFPMRI